MTGSLLDQLSEDARTADELHERSRALLERAVRRGAAEGLTQRQIAAAIGRSQPEVSRLLRFHGRTGLGRRLAAHRARVIDLAASFGARNVRVFGSVARGDDRADSDIDLLVDVSPETSLFALAALERALADELDAHVDVVPSHSLRAHLVDRVHSEAAPL